jgi:hypothetical protein
MEIVRPENSLGFFAICPEHKQRLEKIILHEAGHYVIARRLGFQAYQIKICLLYEGGQHDCYVVNNTARKLQNQAAIERFLEERILTLFSGAMAEALTEGKVDNEVAKAVLESEGGRNDEGKISELIHLLNNISHANLADDAQFKEALTAITRELWDKSRALVEAEQEVILNFTKELASKIEVGGEEYIFSEEDIEAMLTEAFKAGKKGQE